ncbi:hypothetical protein TNCV_4336871 [Trichonephila clavipes]|nr:hypothetical protein TNCV_4336871 [Trichonephila clavipes]
MLGRRIAARPRPPATVRDLEIALLEEWNSISQSMIDNLIASMTNRTERHCDSGAFNNQIGYRCDTMSSIRTKSGSACFIIIDHTAFRDTEKEART